MRINELFQVRKGEGDYRENLEVGTTPLISATTKNNGIMDFVDFDPIFSAPVITVERVTGQAFVQLLDFVTVPDDISVLIPREPMSLRKLFFIASEINLQKWKYHYGRKLTPTRLKIMEINLSEFVESDLSLREMVPLHTEKTQIQYNTKYRNFDINDLFEIERGDFHSIEELTEGEFPTVSRVSYNNGIVGYYEPPNEETTIYEKGLITISTVTGDAFIQLTRFISTDNVLICIPKIPFRKATLFFIQFMLNSQRWRFSYGRQPYKRIFSKTKISFPVIEEEIDEDYIEQLISNCYGWRTVERSLA